MNFSFLISLASALCGAVLFILVLFKEVYSISNLAFVAGMLVLTAESGFAALRSHAAGPADLLYWEYWRLLAMSFLPGIWLAFTLSYSRGNYPIFLSRWRTALVAAFVLPLAVTVGFKDFLVLGAQPWVPGGAGFVVMGRAGTLLHVFVLCFSVLILLNLEQTFRASVGTMRWRIKFMVLGVGLLFASRIYTSSQSILFSNVDLSLAVVDSGALILMCLLVARSLFRAGLLSVDVYPSRTLIQNSLTVLLTGLYLLIVGIMGRVASYFGWDPGLQLQAFIILVLAAFLTTMLLSDRFQRQIKQLVTRHFRRPQYDYRQVWMTFTERTASLTDEGQVCRAIAKWVSESFNALSVNIWLTNETRTQLRFGASTAFGEAEGRNLVESLQAASDVIQPMRTLAYPVGLEGSHEEWARDICQFNPIIFPEGGNRICVPLVTAGEVLGVMIVGDRVGGVAFSTEDMDLLKCIGDQVAGDLLNIELSQKLLQAKEMEAFQSMSTFFVHDLKNTASTLSLMLKNLPEHFHDPSFRADALRAIGKTVDRINELISRLSLLRQKLEMNLVELDLNQVVTATLDGLVDAHKLALDRTLEPLPKIVADGEQLQKVLTNLVLNAKDALGPEGRIHIRTFQQDRWLVISVADNGCGIAPDFIARSLFRPFQTTKKKGIGIGMFHSKMIVEAHRGRFEVESELEKGTTFRVLLPI